MTTKTKQNQELNARMTLWIALLAGIFGFFCLFMLDGMMLTFMVSVSAVVGLAGSRKNFDERENQLLGQSCASAFEILFVVVYFAYTFVVLSNWLHIGVGITNFMNANWPGLMASGMCILLGIIGLRNFQEVR